MPQFVQCALPDVTVLIAGRPTVFRLGLVGILRERYPLWSLIEAETYAAAEECLAERKPEVVLIDEQLPGFGGTDDLRRIRGQAPDTKILILADADDRERILEFIDAGALGYITTSANPPQALAAFNAVLCGGVYAPASLTLPAAVTPQRVAPAALSVARVMTDRQKDVFDLMAQGHSTKLIARELGLAVGTVKVHLAAIYRLLGAHSRTEAVARIAGIGGHRDRRGRGPACPPFQAIPSGTPDPTFPIRPVRPNAGDEHWPSLPMPGASDRTDDRTGLRTH